MKVAAVGWVLVAVVVSCAPGAVRQTSTAMPSGRQTAGGDVAGGLVGGERVVGERAGGEREVGELGGERGLEVRTKVRSPEEEARLAFVRLLLAVPPGHERHPCRVGSLAECEPLLVPMRAEMCGTGSRAQLAAATGLWRFGLACRRFGVGCAYLESTLAYVGFVGWALTREVFGPVGFVPRSAK